MAEPIGVASGLRTLAAFAFQSSVSLYQAVGSLQSNQRTIRELRDELEALNRVLASLRQTAANSDADLAVLNLPVFRCGKACKDFEGIIKSAALSGGTRPSFRDWAKLKYMGEDIVGFKNMLAGYKSTINIALADRNLRTGAVTTDVLAELKEKITKTIVNLEDHLHGIKGSQTLLLQGTAVPRRESGKRDPIQAIDSGPRYSSLQGNRSLGDYTIDQARILEEERSTRQCLAICAMLLEKFEDIQHNIFEDFSVAHNAHQVVVTTYRDHISIRPTTLGSRSRGIDGQLSDASPQRLTKGLASLAPEEGQQPHPLGESIRSANVAISQGEYSEDAQSSSSVGSDTEVESILSAPESVNSSKSSTRPGEVMNVGADEIIDALLQSEEMRLLYEKAIDSEGIGAERFERKLRCLLNQYSSDLKKIARTPDEKVVAGLIQYRSRYMAHMFRMKIESHAIGDGRYLRLGNRSGTLDKKFIIERYLKAMNSKPVENRISPPDVASSDSDSDVEGSGDEWVKDHDNTKFPGLSAVTNFLFTGDAYIDLRASLWYLIDPSLKLRLESLVLGIEFCPPESIRVASQIKHSWTDRYKSAVEECTGANWDWWPMAPPTLPLRSGYRRLQWTCTCGEERSEDVPVFFSQCTLRKYQPSTLMASPQAPRGGASSTQDSTQTQSIGSGGQIKPSLSRPSNNCGDLSQRPGGSSGPAHTVAIGSGMTPAVNTPNMRDLYVLLGVAVGDEINLKHIDIRNHTDDEFFEKLRFAYQTAKGVLRKYLSIWVYSHCDFLKFEKFDDEGIAPYGSGIPPPSNKDYRYNPKPMEHEPPITKHEFKTRFYTRQRRCLLANHCLPFRNPFHKCKRPCRFSLDAVNRVPKRLWPVETGGAAREIFWGLYAVEDISVLRVSVFHFVALVTPFVFWFLWLFYWGHSGDLQNASVPFTCVLGLISLFWFPLVNGKQDAASK